MPHTTSQVQVRDNAGPSWTRSLSKSDAVQAAEQEERCKDSTVPHSNGLLNPCLWLPNPMDAEIRVCLLFALTSAYLLENPQVLFLPTLPRLCAKILQALQFPTPSNRLSYLAALPENQRPTQLLPLERT